MSSKTKAKYMTSYALLYSSSNSGINHKINKLSYGLSLWVFSNLDEGRPRIECATVIINKPINIIKLVYGIGPEKLLS